MMYFNLDLKEILALSFKYHHQSVSVLLTHVNLNSLAWCIKLRALGRSASLPLARFEILCRVSPPTLWTNTQHNELALIITDERQKACKRDGALQYAM